MRVVNRTSAICGLRCRSQFSNRNGWLGNRLGSVGKCRKFSRKPIRRHCSANGESNESGPLNSALAESDSAYLAKLAALSVGGALTIKYGSLLLDLPFSANPAAALAIIYIPTILYGILFLTRQKDTEN